MVPALTPFLDQAQLNWFAYRFYTQSGVLDGYSPLDGQ
jgi:hypothetical protein